VLYAEASGSGQVQSQSEREKEKAAILNVKYFRLNRAGYPNRTKPQTFSEVCKAPNQFESVYSSSTKFSGSGNTAYINLKKIECADLAEAILAVKLFMDTGPDIKYIFDNFRGGKGKHGETIGLTRFWLSEEGARLHEKEE
jgi:hypothetical protein